MKKIIVLICLLISVTFTIGCVKSATLTSNILDHHQRQSTINHLQNSTVALMDMDMDISGKYTSFCTGVWINQTQILTAKHCLENYEGFVEEGTITRFMIFDQFHPDLDFTIKKENLYISYTFAFASDKDIAVLSAVDSNIKHEIATIYDDDIYDGFPVIHVGHPFGMPYSVIDGTVSKTRVLTMFGQAQKLLHITVLTWGGSSGGGAYSTNGELVGITLFRLRGIPGMKFFLHRDEIVSFLNDKDIKFSRRNFLR